MRRVVFYVSMPLALYQSLNQLFKILDSMMASHIGATSVSTVAYLSQINLMFSSVGTGLAVGAGIKISEAYGAGDYTMVKKRISSLFALCALLGAAILLILVPFAPQFLRLAKTPEAFLAEGTRYFILELFAMVIGFFNNIYIVVERARGKSKRILHLNIGVIAIKLTLTAVFIYIFNSGIQMIAVATIISNLFMLTAGIINLRQSDSAFSFSLSYVTTAPDVIPPMLKLSFPVIFEKLAFSFGKVIVNSMSTIYNAITVGALGISGNISGIACHPESGFQEGGSSLISQSLGANQPKRALEAFKWVTIYCLIISSVFCVLSLVFVRQIAWVFAGDDTEFLEMIVLIYRCEGLSAVPMGIITSVMTLLYGFGYTKTSVIINFSRLFVFRIPLLWYLQNFTNLGSVSVGIVMGASNIASGLLAMVIGIYEVRKICKLYNISFWKNDPVKIS